MRSAVAAALCWLFLLGSGTPQTVSASQVTIGRLKYGGGGDWYANPSSIHNWLREVGRRLDLKVAEREAVVEIMDDDLFNHPFLHMTGHGKVRFTSEEAERLRTYLTSGGFLHADDNYGMDEYFRREIRKVFPEDELVELPFTHEIYHTVYSFPRGLPKIHEHHGGPPHGYGIFHQGRLVVFYTYNTDIGDGLEDGDVHNDPPEVREQAMRMAINILGYALTQ